MKLSPGSYFIGDLSNVLLWEDWEKVLSYENGEFSLRGKSGFNSNTAWGDGEYYDQDGHIYSVDAGSIGIVPVDLCIETDLKDIVKRELGRVVEFAESFTAEVKGGNFRFGEIEIITDGSDEAVR